MVCVINSEYSNKHYVFSIDSENETELLPRHGIQGQDILCSINTCNPGSMALCTADGSRYILKGDTNEWVKLTSSNGSNSGSGDSSNTEYKDYDFADKSDIDAMF